MKDCIFSCLRPFPLWKKVSQSATTTGLRLLKTTKSLSTCHFLPLIINAFVLPKELYEKGRRSTPWKLRTVSPWAACDDEDGAAEGTASWLTKEPVK